MLNMPKKTHDTKEQHTNKEKRARTERQNL